MLHQGDIIPIISVNLSGIVFPEAVGADTGDSKVITYDPQLLLDDPFSNREDNICSGYSIVQAVTTDKLIQGKRNCKHSGLSGLLLDDGETITVSITDDISKSEFQNIRNADA